MIMVMNFVAEMQVRHEMMEGFVYDNFCFRFIINKLKWYHYPRFLKFWETYIYISEPFYPPQGACRDLASVA